MALIDNLVAYYKLDGNSNDSVSSNNGTDTNITYNTSYGKINQGANFNGSSSKIAIADSSALTFTDKITVCAWVYTGTTSGNHTAVGKLGSLTTKEFWLAFNTGQASFLLSTDGSNQNGFQQSSNTMSTNTWYLLTGTYDGTNVKLYINDSLIGTTPMTGNIYSGSSHLNIGNIGDYNVDFWSGNIDEVGIWSRALSLTEISQLYNGGNGLSYDLFSPNNSNFFNFFN